MIFHWLKKIKVSLLLSGAILMICSNANSQNVPNGLNFQTIVRDNTGKPLGNRNINLRFTVLKNGAGGTALYSEEHRTLSNEFGLVNALIGYGFPVLGKFDQIKWEDGSTFLKTEIDPNGGINYELSSITPFLSVPYAMYAAKTYLEAGPGIQISGSKITNTGDPDPNDDLHNGSSVGGDLNGTLPNPKVTGLQGLPLSSNAPLTNQGLVWNGNQWLATSVDTDPTNDLVSGTPAGGDLSGNYPSPSVVRLNGIPLSTSKPDSGDVLTYVQGEWKHLPGGPGTSGSSNWKKSGSELVLEDPVNIKTVNTNVASISTQARISSIRSGDSVLIEPASINMTGLQGGIQMKQILKPDYQGIFNRNQPLVELESWSGLGDYSSMDFYQLDTSYRERWSYFNPVELQFRMDRPERRNMLGGNYYHLDHLSKVSPIEYSGIDIIDSNMIFFNGNNLKIEFDNDLRYGGATFLYDKNGKDRIQLSSLLDDQSQPYFGMFCTKNNRVVSELLSTSNAGEFYLYNTNTNQLNVYAGYSNLGPVYPFLGIGDAAGAEAAGMYLNNFGQGVIFADVKSFRVKDPDNSSQEIWYASVEGPEAAAYVRGTATLKNGECLVSYPEHFIKVAQTNQVTVQLTPGSIETYGLAVVGKTTEGFLVKELMHGHGNFSFDWEVKAVRKGHEQFEVMRPAGDIKAATQHRSAVSNEKKSERLCKINPGLLPNTTR